MDFERDIIFASYNTRLEVPKPDFPYAIGSHLQVGPHVPPQPPREQSCHLEFETHRERQTVDPVQCCFLHPPSHGSFTSGTVELEIVDFIRAGDEHSAQLFAVRVLSSSLAPEKLPFKGTNEPLVAKMYDPLYYDHEQDAADPFICVDIAYKRESAAYAKLGHYQGKIIPRFFGSFSLSMPVNYEDINDVREVRLILMEYVSATCLLDLDPSSFSQSERQTIMKRVIDFETALYNCDVANNDIHPRNVMVSNNHPLPLHDNHTRTIVLVDLGKTRTNRSPVPKWGDEFLPGVPITPLLRWIRMPRAFADWIDWDWSSWVHHHYEHERDSITPEMRKRWGPRE